MASSYNEVNTCRDIVPYVPPISIIYGVQTMVQQNQEHSTNFILAPTPISSQPMTNERKGKLRTSKEIATTFVDFVIVPSEGEANLYTIKLKENEDEPNDPHGLNKIYYSMLHGWKAQRRHRQNGKCETFYFHESSNICRSIGDVRRHIFKGFEKLKIEVDQEINAVKSMVGVGEKRSRKRKGESSISEMESATKKLKSNEHNNNDNSETEMCYNDAWNNLIK